MDAEWSVELTHDDASLELPWSSADLNLAYVDLKNHPERISEISEAAAFPELAEALIALNAASSAWLTAKCDVWTDHAGQMETNYDGALRMGSYIDLVLVSPDARFSFATHEQIIKRLAVMARQSCVAQPELPVSAEFILRRCWYRDGEASAAGYYITCYVFGCGNSQAEARANWSSGLRHVAGVLAALLL